MTSLGAGSKGFLPRRFRTALSKAERPADISILTCFHADTGLSFIPVVSNSDRYEDVGDACHENGWMRYVFHEQRILVCHAQSTKRVIDPQPLLKRNFLKLSKG